MAMAAVTRLKKKLAPRLALAVARKGPLVMSDGSSPDESESMIGLETCREARSRCLAQRQADAGLAERG
jgi:hypothetical protein